MDTHTEKRKLAAVMFADIEGYTGLFQKNEAGAFQLLEQHRKGLKEIAEKHKGHIVKYYGDGSLTIFTSVIEAAKCAIDLQAFSIQHDIALRIGLHMGEMIEKDKDVYGDAVNVASRIQAIGTRGSILVSKTVEDELKNHPEIHTKSLGFVKLKNVKATVHVFALTNSGLSIPHGLPGAGKRRLITAAYLIIPIFILALGALWYKYKFNSNATQFGDACIIIPPFVSYVPNGELDYFATMASSELIKAMGESAKANIIPYSTMILATNANILSFIDNPALSKRLGADIQVRGEYTLEGKNKDTLRISLSILDLKKNRLFQTPIKDIKCAAANNRDCLEEAKNILVGYWKSKEDYLFHLTTDSAYINFHRAQNLWGVQGKQDQIKSYLNKATTYDPKFLDGWFLLLDLFHDEEEYEYGYDTIAFIEKKLPDLDQRSKDHLAYYKADFLGKNIKAFKLFLKEYLQNPNDLYLHTSLMVMALEYINDPLVTIRLFNERPVENIDLSTCPYCYTSYNTVLKAYMQIYDVEKARELVEQIKPYASLEQHFVSLLKYYVMIHDTESIKETIRTATKVIKDDNGDAYPDEEAYLCLLTGRIAAVRGNIPLRDLYASKAIQYYEKNPAANLARSYILIDKLAEAKSIYLSMLKKSEIRSTTYAYLGLIYAKEGNKDSANIMIQKLTDIKKDFDVGYTPYYQGRIKANLGEFDSAIDYFKIALEEGIRFLPTTTFLNDPDMIVMNANKEYLSLLSINRLNKIE